VAHARRLLDATEWVDGRVTAGRQSAQVKDNLQLPEDHPVAHELGELILTALQNSALFASAALPNRVFPPLFNLYRGGQSFGNHVDNAIRQIRERRCASAPISRRRCSSPSRMNTMAGS
jgi:PKHD-type hydroxylase